VRGEARECQCYWLTNVTVRSFYGGRYLSIGQECTVMVVEDIGEVIDVVNLEDSPGHTKVIKG